MKILSKITKDLIFPSQNIFIFTSPLFWIYVAVMCVWVVILVIIAFVGMLFIRDGE